MFVDYRPINTKEISESIDFKWKEHYKIMFGIILKMFIVLLASIDNSSNHTKCMFLSNGKCKIYPTLINLHTNEYKQELHYHPFTVKLDKFIEIYNTLNDISNRACVPNKTEHLNIHDLNMITPKNESNISTEDISCKCTCRFDGKNVI